MKTAKFLMAFLLIGFITACSSDDNSSSDKNIYDNPTNAKREKVKIDISYSGGTEEYGPFIIFYSWITNNEGQYKLPIYDNDGYEHHMIDSEDFANKSIYKFHTKDKVEGVTIMASFLPDDDINKEFNIKIYTDKKVLDERVVKRRTTDSVNYTVLVD